MSDQDAQVFASVVMAARPVDTFGTTEEHVDYVYSGVRWLADNRSTAVLREALKMANAMMDAAENPAGDPEQAVAILEGALSTQAAEN